METTDEFSYKQIISFYRCLEIKYFVNAITLLQILGVLCCLENEMN